MKCVTYLVCNSLSCSYTTTFLEKRKVQLKLSEVSQFGLDFSVYSKMSSLRKISLRVLKAPVIMVAPMNGGINNPAFAAAVINHCGIAGFGFTYHTPQAICKDIADTRALSSGPVNANFFVFDTANAPTSEALASAVGALKHRLSCDDKLIKTPIMPYTPDISVQMEAIWQMKPEILTFHFGVPQKEYIAEASRLGIATGVTATSIQEAQQIQESGADFIIAQGIEAGGHRGMFNSTWAQIAAGASEGNSVSAQTYARESCLARCWLTSTLFCSSPLLNVYSLCGILLSL